MLVCGFLVVLYESTAKKNNGDILLQYSEGKWKD